MPIKAEEVPIALQLFNLGCRSLFSWIEASKLLLSARLKWKVFVSHLFVDGCVELDEPLYVTVVTFGLKIVKRLQSESHHKIVFVRSEHLIISVCNLICVSGERGIFPLSQVL